jgi:hypothetical protein
METSMDSTRTSPAAPTDAADAKRWLDSLAKLYPVPDPHRVENVDRTQALEILRCGPAVFEELLASGLPHGEGQSGVVFDRHDLINLALHSGSGLSMPERAVRYALRWMREDPTQWATPLEWTFHIELSCVRGEECGGGSSFAHTRLLPEINGGAIREWTSDRPVRIDEQDITMSGPGPVQLSGRLRTEGRLMRLRSPQLRAITKDFIDVGYRWAQLPKAVQADYTTVMAYGVAPCFAASLFLENEYRAAGYQAISRSGWILGMLDLVHAWVEVVDDDGVTKSVDVIFDPLSRHAEDAHPELPQAALGSRVNRILQTAAAADVPHTGHTCGDGQTGVPQTRTVIRRVGKR